MNLNKKLLAGVVIAALANLSAGSASAQSRGDHHHGRSHGVSKDAKIAVGVILGAALIGSLISSSQPQPTYAPAPAYYYPPEHTAYSYGPPVVYPGAPAVVVEQPRYQEYRHHHHYGHKAGWER